MNPKILKLSLFAVSLFCFTSFSFAEPSPSYFDLAEPSSVEIKNRILATVNGKTISVMDTVKKMDVFLNRVYPQVAESPVARYQFYSAHWRETLEQLIDAELILLDSEGKDMKVTDADVRESIQERFGPNVMGNLDKLGLTYEETKKMIHTELIVQRMMWFRVNSKAFLSVNPRDVKKAYQQYCVQNPPKEEWTYQVISIRSKEKELSDLLSKKAYDLWKESKKNLPQIVEELKTSTPKGPAQEDIHLVSDAPEAPPFIVQLSEEYVIDDKDLSKTHREVLKTLEPNSLSSPVSQFNRLEDTLVSRLFYLKEHRKTDSPPFEKMADKLESELLNQAVDRETRSYLTKLRSKLSFNSGILHEDSLSEFQPFELK